ncbi:Ditrans,polycis-undecaprenyl-diphosphate synthase ((2E,6E)-farnesyl-diphosphate specific) [uppS] [Acididesulfobacillus acetoxydans]|uniref:Isoprenyl transferase n=1 Tax=Acididesulfobacillus acetoxydans TaxID=1561005 RepID=A0A8S0X6I5_9FIRM|nr:isoprenyl transferase [Acididesulfobacillus acetoxydans]CAA7602550.1 Ditrans,polycis-undecaprenyl-diphosphate synthase ((2E,6E)-farnesyl-diphosphate specific) [uppS] [Acididesulfobacillus acetoxydans]CEJ07304.1 Isoprenyl transferase [Acididesulfobacillus acetoxydans]
MWSGPWKRNKEVSSAQIDRGRIPRHIAIIMDGNGRWAIRRGLPRSLGHKAGVEALRGVVKACSGLGVEYLTVYAFSTENWRRPKEEVGILMNLLTEYLRRELRELDENDVVIRAVGQIEHLPAEARTELARAFEQTKSNRGLVLNLALNYGGRAELVGAVQGICRDVQGGRLKPAEIDENVVDRYLYTAGIPDPDLLIRTSGEMRLSNFLLWQCAYTEMVVVRDYWPDFDEEALLQAIRAYQRRNRRFGGLANE